MTTPMSRSEPLRELLRERVADEHATDLSRSAWRAGQRVRRRRALAVGGGVVAGAVAVSGVVVWGGGGATTVEPRPGSTSPATTSDPAVDAGPDATHQGVPVWWSPDQVEERGLPFVEDGPLPRTIDLDVRGEQLDGPVVMAFALGRTVVLRDAFGFSVPVDVSRLDQVTLPHGYRTAPTSWRMLSPDGARLLFPQDDRLEIYDVASGEWAQISSEGTNWSYAQWESDTSIVVPRATTGGEARRFGLRQGLASPSVEVAPFAPRLDLLEAQPVGGTVVRGTSRAQAWGMGGVGLPARERSTSDPELLAFETPTADGVLAFTGALGDGSDSRSKDCCLAAGWLDDETVVYLSRQAEHTLVAWTVGTHEFRRVATITGGQPDSVYDAVSFAAW